MRHQDIRNQIADVDPAQLATYLVGSGWVRSDSGGTLTSLWHRPEDDARSAEVLLPMSEGLKDYQDRLLDAVEAIAEFERRPSAQVIQASSHYSSDHYSVRVVHDDTAEGTIPLNDGVLLNLRARDLIAASAMTTRTKRRHFSGKRTPEAKEFLKTLRLGQTAIGSYVVTVIAPLAPVQTAQQVVPTTSLTRLVTTNLRDSLGALSAALQEYQAASDLRVFDRAIDVGVSANMCDALVGLSGEDMRRGFEITIETALLDSPGQEPMRFSFPPASVGHIARASNYYKDDYVLADQTVRGLVKKLIQIPGQDNGTIFVQASVAGHEKVVTIELAAAEYADAVLAHGAKEFVESRGDIHVKARTSTLLNPTRFRVLRSGDLFGGPTE